MNSWKVKPLAQATVAGFEPRCGFQACAVTSALQASDWEWPGERWAGEEGSAGILDQGGDLRRYDILAVPCGVRKWEPGKHQGKADPGRGSGSVEAVLSSKKARVVQSSSWRKDGHSQIS